MYFSFYPLLSHRVGVAGRTWRQLLRVSFETLHFGRENRKRIPRVLWWIDGSMRKEGEKRSGTNRRVLILGQSVLANMVVESYSSQDNRTYTFMGEWRGGLISEMDHLVSPFPFAALCRALRVMRCVAFVRCVILCFSWPRVPKCGCSRCVCARNCVHRWHFNYYTNINGCTQVCYVPGTLALGAEGATQELHMETAKQLAHTCYHTYKSMPTNIGPERVAFHAFQKNSMLPSPSLFHLFLSRFSSFLTIWRRTRHQSFTIGVHCRFGEISSAAWNDWIFVLFMEVYRRQNV